MGERPMTTTASSDADDADALTGRDRFSRMIANEIVRLRAARPALGEGTHPSAGRLGTGGAAQPATSFARVGESSPPLPERASYHLRDFLAHHDEDFVRNVYRGLLRREPDIHAHDYVAALREGRLAKVEVAGRVRFSREGRNVAIPVRGLALPFALRTLRRVPVLGRLVGIAQYIVRLPDIAATHERFEAAYFHRDLDLRRRVDALVADVERALQSTVSRSEMEQVSDRVGRSEDESRRARAGMKDEILQLRQSLAKIGTEIARLDAAKTHGLAGTPARSSDADTDRFDAFYVSFEDRFRGTRDMIRERTAVYLPLIEKANAGRIERPVLDLGCGRGEWLELLSEHGRLARGVDTNAAMIRECRDRGLDVVEADALSYMRSLESASIGAITGIHVIEHLSFEQLVALVDESLRVLVAGGVVAFETPNPENLVVGACGFHADPTHRRPLPPEPIRFLFEARGFVDVEIMRLHPAPEFQRTRGESDEWRDRLNELLFGPQDYAVTGRKA